MEGGQTRRAQHRRADRQGDKRPACSPSTCDTSSSSPSLLRLFNPSPLLRLLSLSSHLPHSRTHVLVLSVAPSRSPMYLFHSRRRAVGRVDRSICTCRHAGDAVPALAFAAAQNSARRRLRKQQCTKAADHRRVNTHRALAALVEERPPNKDLL